MKTAEELIYRYIVSVECMIHEIPFPDGFKSMGCDDLREWACNECDDGMYEAREGEIETDVECDWSRHYESKSVAAEVDGQWVGWTYWYGGGKHGERDAYLLDCEEEEVMTIQRTFKKVEK
jgi:hypothetical protein